MDTYDISCDTNTNGGTFESILLIRECYLVIPKRCYDSNRWIVGKAYRDDFGHYYHPEEVYYSVLSGDYRIEE